MSADYQALILFSIAFGITLHSVVFTHCTSFWKLLIDLGIPAIAFIYFGYRVFELETNQIAVWVFSFVAIAGIHGGTYEAVLRPYVRGDVLKTAYLAHIGLWSGLIVWSTRWII